MGRNYVMVIKYICRMKSLVQTLHIAKKLKYKRIMKKLRMNLIKFKLEFLWLTIKCLRNIWPDTLVELLI